MYAIELDQHTITIRVTDLNRAQRFYEELLGLTGKANAVGVLLEGVPDSFGGPEEGDDLKIQLVPSPTLNPDNVWLSVEVAGVTDVLDLYLLSAILGSKASLPRKRGDRWSTVVTDPDGHRLSIWAPVEDEQKVPGRRFTPFARVSRSPRLEWEIAHRHGYEAHDQRDHLEERSDPKTGHGSRRTAPGRLFDDVEGEPGRHTPPARKGV